MTETMTIGLLPLYIELYDRRSPERRAPLESFYNDIKTEIKQRQVRVVTSPVCRLAAEFAEAVASFEAAEVDAIVTLHLAYSPSLESVDALAGTDLPIVVLDTTPDYDFSADQDPAAIMRNHGIHGVQDLCNLLIRRGKPFSIEAGHWESSDVVHRVVNVVAGHRMAKAMKSARVGRMGPPFAGMGDFAVTPEVLEDRIGMKVLSFDPAVTRELLPAADEQAVSEELAADEKRFTIVEGTDPAHLESVRAGLTVRRWIEREKLSGFTFNFLAFDGSLGFPTVPFLEASKAMARGIGYAGEGDVLTSALVGALAGVYRDTTFTETFCPDWKNGTIFMSHMGEVNIELLAERPKLMVKPFVWSDIADPAVAVGRLRAGDGCLVNCAPGPDDAFSLVIVPGTMVAVEGDDRMADTVHGWFKPEPELPRFLERYSRVGGTHHSAFSYGASTEALVTFARDMGFRPIVIDGSDSSLR